MLRVENSCGLGTNTSALAPRRPKPGLDWGHAQTPVTKVLDKIWMAQEVTQHQQLLDLAQKMEKPFMGSINYTSQEASTE